jgi:chromosome segregation protein
VVREAERCRETVLNLRRASLKGTQTAEKLAREASAVEAALADAEVVAPVAKERLDAAERAVASAHGDLSELDRRLSRLSAEAEKVHARREEICAERNRMNDAGRDGAHHAILLAARAAEASRTLEAAIRGRRSRMRARRAAAADAHRRASEERTALGRRAVELAGRLAAARAAVERTRDELERAQRAADAAAEEIRSEWGATLEDARRAAEREPPDVAGERQRLARRLKRFGDVNLLALSQEGQLRRRHEFVRAQRADAEEAADKLGRMIQGIDREIEARFSRTFRRVREAFGQMVPKMMVEAEGILELSEEGVEIGLRLGRRGWKPLRVLSGGERALLALSFLFGIFLSGSGGLSGPFCVLDEAEAALDDINLARFLAVVDSHRKNGQFLLVTHQKRTMASADVLYGITQDATGATVVVSKRMRGD